MASDPTDQNEGRHSLISDDDLLHFYSSRNKDPEFSEGWRQWMITVFTSQIVSTLTVYGGFPSSHQHVTGEEAIALDRGLPEATEHGAAPDDDPIILEARQRLIDPDVFTGVRMAAHAIRACEPDPVLQDMLLTMLLEDSVATLMGGSDPSRSAQRVDKDAARLAFDLMAYADLIEPTPFDESEPKPPQPPAPVVPIKTK